MAERIVPQEHRAARVVVVVASPPRTRAAAGPRAKALLAAPASSAALARVQVAVAEDNPTRDLMPPRVKQAQEARVSRRVSAAHRKHTLAVEEAAASIKGRHRRREPAAALTLALAA